jgi:hypothetical protein
MVTAPVERSEVRGHLQQIEKSAALTVGGAYPRARSAAAAAPNDHQNDHQNLAALTVFAALSRAREVGRRDADRAARPARAAWVVQRLLAARW